MNTTVPFELNGPVHLEITHSYMPVPAAWEARPLPPGAHTVKIDRKRWTRMQYVRPLSTNPDCLGMCAQGWLISSFGITPENMRGLDYTTLQSKIAAISNPVANAIWMTPEAWGRNRVVCKMIAAINDAPLHRMPELVPALSPYAGDNKELRGAKEQILTMLFTHLGVRLEFEGEVELDNLPEVHAFNA